MFRKGVSALIINKKNEFLLVNLESFEDKYFSVPGGGVEQEETLEDAVYREIYEELSIEKKSLQFVGQSNIPIRFKFKAIKMIRDGKNYEGSERYFFGFRFVGTNNEIQPKKGEVRFCKWIPFVQLKDYLLIDEQLKDTQEKIKEIFNDKLPIVSMSDLQAEWKKEEQSFFAGWDFSHLKNRRFEDKLPWDYFVIAKEILVSKKSLLDIATGGGENLSKLVPLPEETWAMEGYEPNVSVAKQKLAPLGVKVVYADETQTFPFSEGQFDIVLNRHGGLNLSEIYRVLQPCGQFLSQQVSGNDLADLAAFFGSKGQYPNNLLEIIKDKATKVGFKIKRAEEWTGSVKFLDVGAVVYFLKSVPWVVKGFSVDTHMDYLMKLQNKLDQGEELKFSIRRFLLWAQK